jgi:hypothetical protein
MDDKMVRPISDFIMTEIVERQPLVALSPNSVSVQSRTEPTARTIVACSTASFSMTTPKNSSATETRIPSFGSLALKKPEGDASESLKIV